METKENEQIVYKGSKALGNITDALTMTFTIKAHSEFNGAKQTTIARPKVIEHSN